VLVSFGGAGGLHAVDLARSLSIPQVLVPANAATLSAFGMLAADVIKDYARTIMRRGDTPYSDLEALIEPLADQGLADLIAEGVQADNVILEWLLDMRYQGQSYELMIPFTPDFANNFHLVHAQSYGYSEPGMPVEIVNVRVRAIGSLPRPPLPRATPGPPDPKAALIDHRPVILGGSSAQLPFYDGTALLPGHRFNGPAIVVHPDTTVLAGPGDRVSMDEYRNLIIDLKT
jgi:N-methylhydantoinase A